MLYNCNGCNDDYEGLKPIKCKGFQDGLERAVEKAIAYKAMISLDVLTI